MPPKKWPFPGDSPVARARKIALAYRATAKEQHELLGECANLLRAVDRRLVAFTDPAVLSNIDTVLKKTREQVGPDDLDRRFIDWGEEWHADIPITYDDDDLITSKQAGQLLNIDGNTVSRLRVDGRIEGHYDKQIRGYRYKVADVWKLSTKLRGRNWRKTDPTDRVTDNGSSDPK